MGRREEVISRVAGKGDRGQGEVEHAEARSAAAGFLRSECRLHWMLDVVFHENDARTRKNHAPEHLAVWRRLACNVLEAYPADLLISKKMKHASWSKDYLFDPFIYVS